MLKFWKKKPSDAGADASAPEEGTGASTVDPRVAAWPSAPPPLADDVPEVSAADALEAATAVARALDRAEPPQDVPTEAIAREAAAAAEPAPPAAAATPGAPEPDPKQTDIAQESPSRPRWRERLGQSAFARGLSSLFVRHPRLDDALLDEVETCLITADVGVAASTSLVESLRRRMDKREFSDVAALRDALRDELLALLRPVERPLDIDASKKPFVILAVGVNGVGKTTTIGKLARRYRSEGRHVVLAAGDTFRAAAVEQLQAWGARERIEVVAQRQGSDAASVVFDALQSSRSRGVDVLIADTAGRLHTQSGLMDELAKVRRVIARLDASAPHEVLMVIDGNTGQNAVSQVRQFRDAAGVTGLVVTKLDGTARGGVVFALAKEFGLPIRYVGLGEKAEDLRVFDAGAFVDALLPESLARA